MPLIFALLVPCAMLWFCAPGGGLSQLTADAATPPPVTRWEYKYDSALFVTGDPTWLNKWGADGWELCAVHGSAYVFKRRAAAPSK
jgi:hypothetical protein